MPTFTNAQDYFNQSVAYIQQQDNMCVDDSNTCTYCDEFNNRCAIGYWIPDGHPALGQNDEMSLDGLLNVYPELQEFVIPTLKRTGKAFDEADIVDIGLDLACDLQSLHDAAYCRATINTKYQFTSHGLKEIKRIAQNFELNIPPNLELN